MPTIIEQAILSVDGFEKVYKTFEQQVILKGQSKSTLKNYIQKIARISLHFGVLPELLSDDEINEYLTSLALDPKSPSRSSFKHAVYGLRYYFRLKPYLGLAEKLSNNLLSTPYITTIQNQVQGFFEVY